MINSVTASKYFLDNLEKGRFLVLLFRWTASVCEGLLPMQLSCIVIPNNLPSNAALKVSV